MATAEPQTPSKATPPEEQQIYDRLVEIRDRIDRLRVDKSTYVKSKDILLLRSDLIEQIHQLREIRGNAQLQSSNPVDALIHSCYQLISLAYMTIGKNFEAPAIYAEVIAAKRLLEHLKEASFLYRKDLDSLDRRLSSYRETIKRASDDEYYDPHLLMLLESYVDSCQTILDELRKYITQLSPELYPTYERLVSILRCLSAGNTKAEFPARDVKNLKAQLLEIEAEGLAKGIISNTRPLWERYAVLPQEPSILVGTPQTGESLITNLLIRCLVWVEIVEEKQGKIDESFRETYNRLLLTRNNLEKLLLTQAWSLREINLYYFFQELESIDDARIEGGKFVGEGGKVSELYEQRTLLYLLRKSYALIYQLIVSSEPVSEALLPIYNQLKTLKQCLIAVKRVGGVSSPREIYPYSMKLASIDNMRTDGKFMVGQDIPDGQGAVTQLLEDCFEIVRDLRDQLEYEQEDSRTEVVFTEAAEPQAA